LLDRRRWREQSKSGRSVTDQCKACTAVHGVILGDIGGWGISGIEVFEGLRIVKTDVNLLEKDLPSLFFTRFRWKSGYPFETILETPKAI
jgi:hypothetical protein